MPRSRSGGWVMKNVPRIQYRYRYPGTGTGTGTGNRYGYRVPVPVPVPSAVDTRHEPVSARVGVWYQVPGTCGSSGRGN